MDELAVFDFLRGAEYQRLLDMGFRRSGRIVYRPICEGCRECVPIRIPVKSFLPSRSQRRVWQRNVDVTMTIGKPTPDAEKWRVFSDYQRMHHNGTMDADFESFVQFLYESPTDTMEMVYRMADRIVAVGIVDLTPRGLSSVYCYFDPTESGRSLGVLAALHEIHECRHRGLPYWYLGYYVRECRKMSYKKDYQPCELLFSDGTWRPFVEPSDPPQFKG